MWQCYSVYDSIFFPPDLDKVSCSQVSETRRTLEGICTKISAMIREGNPLANKSKQEGSGCKKNPQKEGMGPDAVE